MLLHIYCVVSNEQNDSHDNKACLIFCFTVFRIIVKEKKSEPLLAFFFKHGTVEIGSLETHLNGAKRENSDLNRYLSYISF